MELICHLMFPSFLLHIIIETHFPSCKIVDKPEWQNNNKTPTKADWVIANNIVTYESVRWAIESYLQVPVTFSPLFYNGPDHLIPWLAEIFKACLAYRYIPLTWREVKVVFLPKPG
ncbi:jg4986 [Pararge aegeria aegeria]|uniref:Jg4986 protein n=1 Tax=Pararge aegeria aegeria TaxID=348720 RepID=A0A8S4QUR8_9NEOP|nr:jg4986 [Pararge aegeria aegeria]